ncbi:hypothetical protein Droror1_Dr00012037, partial [Drosera rotundifolia]
MKKLQAQKGRAGGLLVNQPRSWSQLGSFEAHPALMLVITAPIGEVSQDAVWDAVDSEENFLLSSESTDTLERVGCGGLWGSL